MLLSFGPECKSRRPRIKSRTMPGLIGVMRIYAKHAAILLAAGALLQWAALHSLAQDAPKRPRITGIDHVRLYASNLDASRSFYTQIVRLHSSPVGCARPSNLCFDVNEHQEIELVPTPPAAPGNWVAEIGFATDNVKEMRRYLLANGITATNIVKDGEGAEHFELRDPEGTPLAFTQRPVLLKYPLSSAQIGARLFHAGFVVKNRDAENRFYLDLLGFKLYWYGGFKDDGVDWYEIQVPDGSDWIEYMLNIPVNADHKELGIQNHFSLGVKDIHAAAEQLRKNGVQKIDGPEIGRDGKWGLDVYDPDGTRVEFMEFTPAGKPCCHPYSAPHPQL